MITDLKLSVFGTLQAYESKPLTLDTILWWIRHDKSVTEKTELYRSMAKTITPDEAKKKGVSNCPLCAIGLQHGRRSKKTYIQC